MFKNKEESAAGPLPLTRWQQIRSQIRHVLENWCFKTCFPGMLIRKKYNAFQQLRRSDRISLEYISKLEEISQKKSACDYEYIKQVYRHLDQEIHGLVEALVAFNPVKYALLRNYQRKYSFYARLALAEEKFDINPPYVLSLDSELSEELAGGKATPLSRLIKEHNVPIPPGFVITTKAFFLLLESGRIKQVIEEQLKRLSPGADEKLITSVSQTITKAVKEAQMPPELGKEVQNALKTPEIKGMPLAMRSSAVGEDLKASFAGQFETFLNVDPSAWFESYKDVVASKYSPHALYYRMSRGFSDRMTPMAVLVMPTVKAQISGILYTHDPHNPGVAVSYMVKGSGEALADGGGFQAEALWDNKEHRLLKIDPPGFLKPEVLKYLFELGHRLEAAGNQTARDVEWLIDDSGRILILQSRALQITASEKTEPCKSYPEDAVILKGQWVSSGQATGKIFRQSDPGSVSDIPDQAILVTEQLPPSLTLVIDRLRAVIAEKASPACHFASVARQAGIPVICNAQGALNTLSNGQTVSIEADSGVVIDGVWFECPGSDFSTTLPDAPVFEKLGSALKFISPLTLEDPDSEDFSMESCRSLHDIVRFVHETGVREMFSLVGSRGLDRYGAKRLDSGLPLVMHVLDVNKGLVAGVKSIKEIKLNQIQSKPMQRLFSGLSSRAVKWNEDILHFDWKEYDRNAASFVNISKSMLFSSYAILDRDYLHALLRFGYHFAVVDSVDGEIADHNYIQFSFKGGGGNQHQRFMRIELIREVLENFGFKVRTTGDLLEAFFERRTMRETGENLARLGIVLGKTVLLDMSLKDLPQVSALAQGIIQESYDIFPVQKKT